MSKSTELLRDRLVRNIDLIEMHREKRDPLYDTLCARLAPGTLATKLGISVDILEPGKRGCPYHFHHAQEEAFVVLEGSGTLRVAGEMLPISAGDTIFIPPGPEFPHQIINTSAAALKYLSISTRDSPEIVEYPDSGKFMASARAAVHDKPRDFERIRHLRGELDYWDGEP